MLLDFKRNIDKQKLFSADSKLLATVSGGVDSVVLCYLLKKLNYNFAIAHCNFQLRSKESDEDEQFTANLAEELSIPFYSKSFQTEKYSEENGISTQMAARKLRYTWFDNLKDDFGFDCILTAHHKNDNVETVLLNLVRGTGHKGLKGIESIKKNIVRPLLPFAKQEIIRFAKDNNISWREDVSNKSNKYKRNLLRNEIIPLLEQLNPNFIQTFSENIEKFNEEHIVLQNEFLMYEGGSLRIDDVMSAPSPLFIIWSWIGKYGFTFSDAKDILSSLNSSSGKIFLSKTHKIIRERKELILQEINLDEEQESIIIADVGEYRLKNSSVLLEKVENIDFSLGENIAFLDAKKLVFSSYDKKMERRR